MMALLSLFVFPHKGMTGKLVLDSNGDREPDYWITDMLNDGSFVKIAEVLNTDNGERVRDVRLHQDTRPLR